MAFAVLGLVSKLEVISSVWEGARWFCMTATLLYLRGLRTCGFWYLLGTLVVFQGIMDTEK